MFLKKGSIVVAVAVVGFVVVAVVERVSLKSGGREGGRKNP